MKPGLRTSLFVLAVIGLAGFGYYLRTPNLPPPELPVALPLRNPPTTTITDATAVFQKAFWQRPSAADKILYAERREWADADGVQKWQWFIAVEPSPELVKRLRVDNVFDLVPASSAPTIEESPLWFSLPPGEADVLQAPQGNLRLIFSKTSHVLYATDAGRGFHAGAPEVTKPIKTIANTGRLPRNSPPNPSAE